MSAETDKNEHQQPKLIVGIGASAGGLDACKRLLGAMPGGGDMALVLVMHLDPSRESHIAEILNNAAALEVVQAEGDQPLEAGCVYIIAPGTALEVAGGKLHTQAPKEAHGARKPADVLFSSLARDQGARAVGIILSGTANDGASGIQDIKARGGLCIVQEPESAEYDGMPQAAIATGVADYVLTPEEIPRTLLGYLEKPGDFGPGKAEARETKTPGAFDRILDLLGRTYGVNFRSAYKRGTLERRTSRRMDLRQIPDLEPYLEVLQTDPAEVAALYGDVLIGVTGFFRDAEVWEALEREVVPDLLARHGDEPMPLKIWVPGCATGEEPYSLAMIFLEQMERTGQQIQLQIFATDIAENALAFARQGLYPPSIADAVTPERRSRFFHSRGEQFAIAPDVRDAVTFAVHNLLADPPFSRLDLVSCRNLLIYLEPHAQQRALELFQFALKPGGLLLLGASETVGQHGDIFEPVSKKARLYRSKATSEAARHHRMHWSPEPSPLPAPVGAHRTPAKGPNINRIIEQTVLSRYTWACVAITESFEIQSFFGRTQDYLMQPTGEARMDLLAWAKPGIYPRMRTALEQARERRKVQVTDMRVEREGTIEHVECTIEPITPLPGEARIFLVAFRDVPHPVVTDVSGAEAAEEPLVRQLEAELKNAREELQGTVEQLESTNEEYRASHEELQSNNEELEASKEELQSLNEEMVTINRQLEDKNAELRTTNADIQNLLQSTAIPVIFLDRELRVRRFTPATTDLMRLIASDVGRSIEHIKMRFRDEQLAGDARKVLDKLSPIETEVETEDGQTFTRRLLPYRTGDDRIDGVCLTFQDITGRKKAAQAIDESRLYAEGIVETVQVPLLVLDQELRVISANARFYDAFQATLQETEGTPLYRLGNNQWDIPVLRRLLEEILPRNEKVESYEVEQVFEQIGRRVMNLNARRMSRAGRPDLILLSIEDITGMRAAERVTEARNDELAQEHQRKDEFLAMLGHELRNPLAALMHGLDLLGLAPDDPARVEQTRAMMTRQARRIGSMLDELLDIARLTAGKIQIAQSPVDLAEAAQTAVEAATPLIKSRKHALDLALPERGEVMVEGDLGRLTQMAENLLSNAAKYTDEGGRIELSLETDEHSARLRVRDTGIGMDAELLPHIFELFTQAPRPLVRSAGGLGLGLTLVKRVVELHGGTVTATSPGRGQGSEFMVTLPRLDERRAPQQKDGDGEVRDAPPQKILVVDDEEDSATALAEILAHQGHATHAVHDGPSALEAAQSFHPDVVLLDIGLPGMDGYEVARQLREAHPDAMRLIALTGYQNDDGRLTQAGFDRHMIKPPDMQKLSGWLGAWGSETRKRD